MFSVMCTFHWVHSVKFRRDIHLLQHKPVPLFKMCTWCEIWTPGLGRGRWQSVCINNVYTGVFPSSLLYWAAAAAACVSLPIPPPISRYDADGGQRRNGGQRREGGRRTGGSVLQSLPLSLSYFFPIKMVHLQSRFYNTRGFLGRLSER